MAAAAAAAAAGGVAKRPGWIRALTARGGQGPDGEGGAGPRRLKAQVVKAAAAGQWSALSRPRGRHARSERREHAGHRRSHRALRHSIKVTIPPSSSSLPQSHQDRGEHDAQDGALGDGGPCGPRA